MAGYWSNLWLSAAIALCIGLLLGGVSRAQTIQYSENFTNGVGYSPGQQQYDNWISFRAALGGGADSITISGSNDATGRSCTNPTTATQIANALSSGTTLTTTCDGNTWRVGTCGTGIELNSGTSNICQCGNAATYTVRPTLSPGNRNWGGVNSATCNGPTQTMIVTVADTTAPTISINAPTVNEAATFDVTFQFSEAVTGFDISDITVTNGTASGFVTVDADTYTVTITPSGALDITVSVAAGTAQDIPGNLLSNSDTATVFYLPTTGGGTIDRYSEDFTQGTGYSPGSAQYDNWLAFRAGLTGTYTSITISGTNDGTGRSCSVPATATQIANALNTGTTLTTTCDGNTWRVGTCGTGIELNSGTSNICQCGSAATYTVRPTLSPGNRNWGGVNSATCNGPSQTMTVEVNSDTVPPTVTITDVPATTDGSTPFVVTFTFSEDVTGMTLADVNSALTNATASGLTETIPNRRYTVTITPDGGGDVDVGLNAGAVQDAGGNNNTAATTQTAVLQAASFSIVKNVDIADTTIPTTLTYTITITNTGTLSLTAPVLTDTLTQGGAPRTLSTGPVLSSGDTNTNNVVETSETWVYTATYDVTTTDISDGNDLLNTAVFNTAETSASQDTATTTISPIPPPPPVPASCSGSDLSINGGFETPDVPGAPPSFSFFPQASVPGWSTTDSAGNIELWDNGFNGVPSHSGLQFAELNANSAGTLSQTASVNGRAELLYYWAHRARSLATETASLTITDDDGGSTTFGNYSSGTGAWNTFSAIHVANPGATTFTAAHSTILGGSLGNFHDSIEACQTYVTLNKTELSRQDVDTSGGDSVGDTITYRFVIANPAGNARSLGSVVITDDQIGTINVTFADSGDTNSNALLDPGESWVKDATHTITQADMDSGSVVNIAFAQANTADNTLRTDDATVTANLTVSSSIDVTKIASAAGFTTGNIQEAPAGTIVTYTYTITNTGNQTVSNISLSDIHSGTGTAPAPDPDTATLTDNGAIGDSSNTTTGDNVWDALGPGDVLTVTASYTVTQSDVDTLQ